METKETENNWPGEDNKELTKGITFLDQEDADRSPLPAKQSLPSSIKTNTDPSLNPAFLPLDLKQE